MTARFFIRLIDPLIPCFIAVFAASPLFSQEGPTGVRKQKPSSTGSTPGAPAQLAATRQTSANQQQLERLAKVTDKILAQIQLEENDLFSRLNYFEKPERLDPSSFASKDEIAQWQGILQQLKEKSDRVAGLYADVGKQLDVSLKAAGASEEVSTRFKKLVLEGFPWDQIERKKQLIADFIEEHGKLLTFYEKNW